MTGWIECPANGFSCLYGPHGPSGEQQCRDCGSPPPAGWCLSHGRQIGPRMSACPIGLSARVEPCETEES